MSRVRLLVGTKKGAFVLNSDGKRGKWEISGPFFGGWEIYHMKGSAADPNRIYVSQSNGWFGQIVQRSDDGARHGCSQDLSLGARPRRRACRWARATSFQYDTSDKTGKPLTTHMWYDGSQHPWEFKRVWHMEPSLHDPNTVYAGVEDAAMFRSTDGGKSWHETSGLRGHGTGATWQPGAGGLGLHTIVMDPKNPKRMFIAISAAGAFRTDDGGDTWKPINKGLYSKFLPNPAAEVGHCVHRITLNPARPDVLFMQKHWDVMRSDDGGENWREVSGDLPTDFGFPIEVDFNNPETAFVFPIKSDSEHYPIDGKLRVYRSKVGGNEWEEFKNGLPEKDCYVNVLREASAVDRLDPCGIYFGTTGGQVFCSPDGGNTWETVTTHLPAVLSVEVQTLD